MGIKNESYSVTLLISLRPDKSRHIFIRIREDSNTCLDFASFISNACEESFLQKGDNIVMDNARIHTTTKALNLLRKPLRCGNVSMHTLPTYSPELNPCELVFAEAKRYIRSHHERYELPFQQLIQEAFSQVTWQQISSFYHHCISSPTPIEQQVFFS